MVYDRKGICAGRSVIRGQTDSGVAAFGDGRYRQEYSGEAGGTFRIAAGIKGGCL